MVILKSEKAKAVLFDRNGVLNKALTTKLKPYPPSTLVEVEIFVDA